MPESESVYFVSHIANKSDNAEVQENVHSTAGSKFGCRSQGTSITVASAEIQIGHTSGASSVSHRHPRSIESSGTTFDPIIQHSEALS